MPGAAQENAEGSVGWTVRGHGLDTAKPTFQTLQSHKKTCSCREVSLKKELYFSHQSITTSPTYYIYILSIYIAIIQTTEQIVQGCQRGAQVVNHSHAGSKMN